MALEYKELEFTLLQGDDLRDTAGWNIRAEVPILLDDNIVVANSSDILMYVDRKYPERPLYPTDPKAFADVREWERLGDMVMDPIFTVIGNFRFANLSSMPDGLMNAADRDVNILYDYVESKLSDRDFICQQLSAADYSLYPHIASGAVLGLSCDKNRHSRILEWIKRIRARPEGASDLAAARHWWAHQHEQQVDTERVNWGAHRLEWLLANGFVGWFANQVQADKVLWSAGPGNNALKHPKVPAWTKPRPT